MASLSSHSHKKGQKIATAIRQNIVVQEYYTEGSTEILNFLSWNWQNKIKLQLWKLPEKLMTHSGECVTGVRD